MKINIQGYRILLKPEEIDDKIKYGDLELVKHEVTKDSDKRNVQKGEVLQVGPDCYKDGDVKAPWCKPGDTVIINPHSGHNFYDDEDNWFIIVNEEDILATIEGA